MGDPNTPKGAEEGLEKVETGAQTEARPQDEPVSITQGDDETAQRQEDSAKADQIRQGLGVDESKNPDLQKTPEQLFETMLKPKMHDVIEVLGLTPLIEKCKGKLEGAIGKRKARMQKKAVKILINAFKTSKIPFKKWAFFPESMVGEKAVNCSGAALIFGVIMNDELGIKTEHVNPWGHAANLVTYSDGTTEFVDPRNRVRRKLRLGMPEKRDGFDIYRINDSVLEYSLLPVSKLEHGAALTLLENVCELQKERENDAEADLAMDDYGYGLDFDFAQQYMKGNFLIERENEEEWLRERDNIKAVRRRQDSFFLIPSH